MRGRNEDWGVPEVIIKDELLATLCCPVRKAPLAVMAEHEIEAMNAEVARGRARYAGGEPVAEPLESGLATADLASVYRIRGDVLHLLPEHRIVNSHPRQELRAGDAPPDRSDVLRIWEVYARNWHRYLPPGRPGPADVAIFEKVVEDLCSERGLVAPRVLLLGVTPEIATMRWPANTTLLALDFSEAMIQHVWPPNPLPGAAVAHSEWTAMPVLDHAYDIVIGDGILLWQKYPDGVAALAGEVRRVLKDGGALVMRVFAKPAVDDPPEAVITDLRRGRVANSSYLYIRLWAALRRDLRSGTRLGDVYDFWHANVPDEAALLPSLGWSPDRVGSFETLRGSETTVSVPTVTELSDLLSPELRQTSLQVPEYDEMGMYPTVVYRPDR